MCLRCSITLESLFVIRVGNNITMRGCSQHTCRVMFLQYNFYRHFMLLHCIMFSIYHWSKTQFSSVFVYMMSIGYLTPTVIMYAYGIICKWHRHLLWDSCMLRNTVFTRFVLHPRIVLHCGTIRRVLSLFLEIMLIAPHPQIVLHHIFL